MENRDLDKYHNEIMTSIRCFSDLDLKHNFNEISISKILYDIDQISYNLKNTDCYIEKKRYLNAQERTINLRLGRKIDLRLQRNKLYKNIIRPQVKQKLSKYLNKKVINGKELLSYEGFEFVDILYQSILNREADSNDKLNALNFITDGGNDKITLIYTILNSDEGKSKNVIIKGIKIKKLILSIKARIYNIPIIGYLFKLIINITLLPKKLALFQKAINMQNNRLNSIENEINSMFKNKDINDINYKIETFQTKLTELEKFKQAEYDNQKKLYRKQKFEKDLIDKFYLRYNEVLMPDSRENVKKRASIYINKINNWFSKREKASLNIVDLGCGECEWIELLNENGYHAQGVDSNNEVVNKVKNSMPEINIVNLDAFEYLSNCKDNSIDLLSSFHMVEHMKFIEIIELLLECKRVLKKDGMILFETPNPQNILISTYYFNMDPTHNKPIPPELLEFMIGESGLHILDKILVYPLDFIAYEYSKEDPISDLVFRFNMEQAYSIMAVKE